MNIIKEEGIYTLIELREFCIEKALKAGADTSNIVKVASEIECYMQGIGMIEHIESINPASIKAMQDILLNINSNIECMTDKGIKVAT